MIARPYCQLIHCKQWADLGLYEVVQASFDRLSPEEGAIVLRILDHIHAVDRIFQHHLRGLPHAFKAARSEIMPDLATLADRTREMDAWYVCYVDRMSEDDLEEPVDFVFTSGKPMRMTRGEIILHVCQHGAYHRGNAGILFQKNGIAPGRDAITDFLEAAAWLAA